MKNFSADDVQELVEEKEAEYKKLEEEYSYLKEEYRELEEDSWAARPAICYDF